MARPRPTVAPFEGGQLRNGHQDTKRGGAGANPVARSFDGRGGRVLYLGASASGPPWGPGKRCESVAIPLTVILTTPFMPLPEGKKPGGKVRGEDEV
mgnify:CR=1 FL=1